MELLKQGDFVVVHNTIENKSFRGLVVCDEAKGCQVEVVIVRDGYIDRGYYDRGFMVKVS